MPEGKAQEPKGYFEVPFLARRGEGVGGPKGHLNRGLGISRAGSRAENPTRREASQSKDNSRARATA